MSSYLKRHYTLNELTCDIEKYPSLDFYQFLKTFQNLFQMTHGKQKDWEQFRLNEKTNMMADSLSLFTKTTYVATCYMHFLVINEDDLPGKKYLLPLFSYRQIFL